MLGVMSRIAPFALVFVAACLSSTGGPPTASATASSSGGSTSHEGSSSSAAEGSSSGLAGTSTTGPVDSTGATPTTGEPLPSAPKIVFAALEPDPITEPGYVQVEASAVAADAVRMRVDGGPAVEMVEVAPGQFEARVAMNTSLLNGPHVVEMTPAFGATEGKPVGRTFDAFLPPGGSEVQWMDMLDLDFEAIATGVAAGLDETSYFIGTLEPAGTRRCWLRRFFPSGGWKFEWVLSPMIPDENCEGVDVAVAADGRLYVLAQRVVNGASRWWLASKATWESPFEDVLWGPAGAVARGLAQAPDGRLAVFGERPTGFGDKDAFVTIYAPLQPGWSHEFDWQPEDVAHKFDEVARDVAFVGDTIVVVGEAVGHHPDDWLEKRSREMVIELDPATKQAVWRVDPKGLGMLTQSAGRGIAADDVGGYVVVGHICPDICVPQLRVRRYVAGAEPVEEFFPLLDTPGAAGIAWHPAGYAVVTAAEIVKPWWSKVWAIAWVPGEPAPLWKFSHSNSMLTNMPLAVAISPFGLIHIAGVSSYLNKDNVELTLGLAVGLAP